jgi:prevent-host-death family protein
LKGSARIKAFTANDLQRNIARGQDAAITSPVAITHHGRPRLVLLSIEEYTRLLDRDRRARQIDRALGEIGRPKPVLATPSSP